MKSTTSLRACLVLEQHPIDRWDKYQLVPKLCEEKCVEEERTCSKSESYHLISEPWWCNGVRKATSEAGSHIFSNVLTAEKKDSDEFRWIMKCFRQHSLLLFSQMLQDSLENASWGRWTLTPSTLWKQPKSLRKRSAMLSNGQVSPQMEIHVNMDFTFCGQIWRKNTTWTRKNWRQLPHSPGRTWPETKLSGDVCVLKTSSFHGLQRICKQILKVTI